MTTGARELTSVSLNVSHDPGHGGGHSHYKIERPRGVYEVSLTISRRLPGGSSFTVPRALPKDDREVADFLSRLALVHRVFELEGRAWPHAFLHPTFYSFRFTDARGGSHEFTYSVEAGRHHDDTYRELVEEFERFFEAKRVAREIQPPEPPGRPTWGKRINWWIRLWTSRLSGR